MADEPHPQVQAVLEMIESQPVPPIHAVSVAEARNQMEAMAAMRGDGEDVGTVENFEIQGPEEPLPVRLYHPEGEGPHPVLVYFHGGGFVIGSLETHDALCRSITNAADCAVLSVDYRLAPENPFPAAVEDAHAAVEWVADHGEQIGVDTDRIAVGGDSAGANLAAATTLTVQDRDGPELAHQALIYPVVSSPIVGEEFDSYEENAEGYFLERDTMEWFHGKYVQDEIHLRNEYFAPLLADDLAAAPSATVLTAGFDPLRDEGIVYADRLESDGVDVTHDHYEDMIHGFATMIGVVDAAEEAVESIATDLDDAF